MEAIIGRWRSLLGWGGGGDMKARGGGHHWEVGGGWGGSYRNGRKFRRGLNFVNFVGSVTPRKLVHTNFDLH